MAGPISHVIYAEKFLQTRSFDKDTIAFILGNLHPDIRYLGVAQREDTHQKDVTLDMIRHEINSFRAGTLLHSFIDETREQYVRSLGIYEKYPPGHLTSIALKVCEDLALFTLSHKWTEYITYLSELITEEKATGIPNHYLQKWHSINVEYFMQPNLAQAANLLDKLGFTSEQVNHVVSLCDSIRNTNDVNDYILNFYNNLNNHL